MGDIDHDSALLTHLEEIYSTFAETPADAAALLAARTLFALGAQDAFIATLSGDRSTIDVARVTSESERPSRLAIPVGASYPIAQVFRDGQELFIENNEQLRCDHPGLVRVRGEDHACATLALHDSDGTLLGALNVGFDRPHPFSDEERVALAALAEGCETILRAAASRPNGQGQTL